jgi:hypothetical protein
MDKQTVKNPLAQDLNKLNTKFAEFRRDCEFLNSAFNTMVKQESYPAGSTAMGLHCFSQWMVQRADKLGANLEQINASLASLGPINSLT